MGFYGNITNTSKTTFQFDKVYPNRAEMEANVNKDSIFLGRYVLIEYDEPTKDMFVEAYPKEGESYLYTSRDLSQATRILFDAKKPNQFSEIEPSNSMSVGLGWICKNEQSDQYWVCTGSILEGETEYAVFNTVANTNFDKNNNIDKERYKVSKGFDSTVWVKTSLTTNNQLEVKYVQVAELNTVVPTFDITVDAPTMSPIAPHFDTDSNNVYYKLHMQPSYGLRVAEKDSGASSDSQTYWTRESYDKNTGTSIEQYWDFKGKEWVNKSYDDPVPDSGYGDAAIYFNYAGFNPAQPNIVENPKDEITILPTGRSGNKYNLHTSGQLDGEANDIQEIRINLPSIGNMMSEAWDIIHGPKRDDSMKQFETENGPDISSLQGRLNSISAMETNQIPIKLEADGSLSGTRINGDNNRTREDIAFNEYGIYDEGLSTSFTEDDAWIYTKVDSSQPNNNNIAIHHTFHPGVDTVSYHDLNSDGVRGNINQSSEEDPNEWIELTAENSIALYTPFVDKAGHVVAEDLNFIKLPNGYKTIITNEASTDTNNHNGNSGTSVAADTQSTLSINKTNKWINIDIDTDEVNISHEVHDIPTNNKKTTNLNTLQKDDINIPDWNFDKAGHIIEKHDHKYTLPFGWKQIDGDSGSIIATNTQDVMKIISDEWLTTAATKKTITISHDDISSTRETSLIKTTTEVPDNDNALTFGTIINIPTVSYDKKGHIISSEQIGLKLPKPSITENFASVSKVVTNITLNQDTGALAITPTEIYNIQLGEGYSESRDEQSFIKKTSTIGGALKSLESYILNLDLPQVGSDGKYIQLISQENGKVSVIAKDFDSSIGAGSSNTNTPTSLAVKNYVDTSITNLVNDAPEALDTLQEIANWIADDKSNAATLISEVRDLEELVGKIPVSTQITNAINDLDVEDTSQSGQYVSAVIQNNGKIEVQRANLPIYTLASGDTDGTVKFNNQEVEITGLGSAAYTESDAYLPADPDYETLKANYATLKNDYDALLLRIEALENK